MNLMVTGPKGAVHKCSLSGYQHLPTTPMSGAAQLRWFQHQAMRPEIMNQSLIIRELSKMPGSGCTLDSRESSSKYVLVTQEELTYNVDQDEALTAPVKAAEPTALREQSRGLCMSETKEAGRPVQDQPLNALTTVIFCSSWTLS